MKRPFLFFPFLAILLVQFINVNGQQTDKFQLQKLIGGASARAFEYSNEFKNLSAEEVKVFEVFDNSGKLESQRKVLSDLIIYESETQKDTLGEYRNIREVNGEKIKDGEKRTVRIFKKLGDAKSFEQELEKLRKESLRYDVGISLYGHTLFQAIPLSSNFVSSFKFEEVGRENIGESEAIVIKFQQTAVNPYIRFQINTPKALEVSDIFYRGQIWLDAKNLRILKLLTEVTLESPKFTEPFVFLRDEYFYQSGEFDIYLPSRIISEKFNVKIGKSEDPLLPKNKIKVDPQIETRVTTEFNKFSKFKVTAEASVKKSL